MSIVGNWILKLIWIDKMKNVLDAEKKNTLKLTRDISKKECPWFDNDLKAGQTGRQGAFAGQCSQTVGES